jgi:hypothetical protein
LYRFAAGLQAELAVLLLHPAQRALHSLAALYFGILIVFLKQGDQDDNGNYNQDFEHFPSYSFTWWTAISIHPGCNIRACSDRVNANVVPDKVLAK